MLDQNAFIMLWRDRGDPKLRLAARVDADTAAALLGFALSDIPILVAAGELKPLGSPADNATKYFWIGDVAERAADRKWLDKATKVVSRHWKDKRVRRAAPKNGSEPVEPLEKPVTELITKGR